MNDDLEKTRIQNERLEKEREARSFAAEERAKLEREIGKEKQRKHQEKLNEIKGKDPWDSGFL